jgi:hypothetical protein
MFRAHKKRRGSALIWVACGLFVAVAASLIYERLTASNVVATIASTSGVVTRDFVEHEQRWSPASVGEELHVGDAVKTDGRSTALLALRDGATLSMEPDTVVRFSTHRPDGSSDFRVEAGEAGLETGVGAVRIETAFGLLSLERNSVVRIRQQGTAARLRVDMGRASFIDPSRAAQTMLPGDELTVENGQSPRLEKKGDKDAAEDEKPAPPLLASTQLVDVELNGAAHQEELRPKLSLPIPPSRADVSVRAGENATVHDPSRGTNARIRFERVCESGEGVIEVGQGKGRFVPRAAGEDAALITLAAGLNRYRVRCVLPGVANARIVASGAIRVVRDAALRRVPLRPPSNTIDLDGRKYTVLYQNRLPSVVLRAPQAVPAGTRMTVKNGSRTRTYELRGDSHTLASGEIGDGTYEIALESAGKTLSSTVLRIAFDNAAPMASLDQQGTLLRDDAGHVHLSGVVPLGSEVSLEGQALTVDIVGRFAASASPSKHDSGVALRVAHPHAGIHYYLRQVDESGP